MIVDRIGSYQTVYRRCIVIILGGKFIFKEKRIAYKLLCAAVVIAGVVIAVI